MFPQTKYKNGSIHETSGGVLRRVLIHYGVKLALKANLVPPDKAYKQVSKRLNCPRIKVKNIYTYIYNFLRIYIF